MCGVELSTFTYRSCTLPQYGGYGRTVQPHKIVSKYIHQCDDPKPAHGSDSICCEERFQTQRKDVTDPGDRGHTKVTGECPACKVAEDRCLEVHIVPNQNAAIRNSDAIEPTIPQPVVEHPSEQNRVAEQSRVAEGVTNHTTESKRKSHSRPATGAGRSQTSHARHNKDGCCIIL